MQRSAAKFLPAYLALFYALTAFCSFAYADGPLVQTNTVAIGGAVEHPIKLGPADLATMPRTTVEASAHGETGKWSGVALIEILKRAGVPLGEAMRGPKLLTYVRISAADGYAVVFSLAELDPGFRDNTVLLADQRDGHALDAKEGTFRLIVPAEKRPARWVRQVTRIDVIVAAKD